VTKTSVPRRESAAVATFCGRGARAKLQPEPSVLASVPAVLASVPAVPFAVGPTVGVVLFVLCPAGAFGPSGVALPR